MPPMLIPQRLTPEERSAITVAVLGAAASAAASALVSWFFEEAQRRLEARPCPKCGGKEG